MQNTKEKLLKPIPDEILEEVADIIDSNFNYTNNVEFDIFYGVSDNDWKIWDISNAEEILSFKPSSNSEAYR